MNKERKNRRKKIKEEIKMEEWKEYFMGVGGGVEERVVKGIGRQDKKEGQEERGLEWEGVRKAIGKIKDGKAMGKDRVPGEVWKYGGEEIGKWIWEVCSRVWRGGRIARIVEGREDHSHSQKEGG